MAPTTKKKTRNVAASSIARKLTAFEKRVKARERDISRIRGGELRRQKAQRESEEVVRVLTGERDTLRETLETIASHRNAAEAERSAAAADLKAANSEWSAIEKRVKKHPAFGKATKAVASVDDRIDKLREKIAGLATRTLAAESKVAAARSALVAVENKRRAVQEAIQKRPHEIRAARGELSNVIAGAKAANPEDVHAFAVAERRFRAAVEELRTLTRSSDDVLANSLLDTDQVDKARARAESETQKLNALRTDAAAAQEALQNLVQLRDHEIRTKILKRRPVDA